ncbi:hypothetical protein, partial [Avibacterium avium]
DEIDKLYKSSLPTENHNGLDYPIKNQDLSWEQFQAHILAFRDEYKGIFIQELTIDWDVPLYQRPQHISVSMGRAGYLAIYRTTNFNDNVNGFRQVAKNVWLTNSSHVNDIEGAVHSFYSTANSIIPEHINNLKRHSIIAYEYIDHIDPEISGNDDNIKRLLKLQEKCFSGYADYIIASARKLKEEAELKFIYPKNVISIPNGVDIHHYRNSIHQSYKLPEHMMNFKKKYKNIVGYFGAIAPWLWYETIEKLVKSRPDLGFIFIGPDYYGGVDKLPKADNFLYLGAIDYKVLPAYAKEFDICFIPFKPGNIARTTSPLKLFEYFALQKPVVVTSDMLECTAFSEVLHSNTVDGLSEKIDIGLQLSNKEDFKERMLQLANENSWDSRVKNMEVLFQKKNLEELHHND